MVLVNVALNLAILVRCVLRIELDTALELFNAFVRIKNEQLVAGEDVRVVGNL